MTDEEREWIRRETERISKWAEQRRAWLEVVRDLEHEIAGIAPCSPFVPLDSSIDLAARREADEPLVTPAVASYLAEWFER